MIENKTSAVQFLRNLRVGEKSVWYCPTKFAQPEMKKFTAYISKGDVNIRISQQKALLVIDGVIPQTVIIVERIK